MEALSAVAGIATAGAQLSKALYDLYSTVRTSGQEIQDVAHNVSLLAMVLEELDDVLCDDGSNFRPQLLEAAKLIVLRCARVFEDIRKHTGADTNLKGKKPYEKLAWYFKRERVKPLRSSLESLKSTLNILLHVVQLAKSTKGIEEYPGVKPIGHWYVRKERRGLVRRVIDNRHALERLKQFEDQTPQADLDLVEEEQPLTFADIFPLSTSNHKRGQSPERKFVVAFGNPVPRSNGTSRRSQEPEIPNTQAGPSTTHGDMLFVPSSAPEDCCRIDLSTDSDAESIGRSFSSRSTRESMARARPMKEQATSRLLLDIIPHEKADETFKWAQNMSWSTILEAKAEETIDTLLRHWTYVDPSYFSEDDRSSITSTEPSLPLHRAKTNQHPHEKEKLEPTRRLSGPHDNSRGRRSSISKDGSLTKELVGRRSVSMGEALNTPSPLSAERNRNAKKRPSPLRPTVENLEEGREAKKGSISHMSSDQGVYSPKEPSTPAPPYPSNHSGQCPSCYATPPSVVFTSLTDRHPYLPIDAQAREKITGDETTSSLDSTLKLFENKILEMMKQPSLQHGTLDSQSRRVSEQREDCQQLNSVGQEAEPVIMKDCLGRKFLFPIEKCRSWQSMENLIKRSFSHIESMNSKIFRGSYDILSPTGEIILPEIWDAVIKPGWVVELRFWDFATAAETSQKDPDVDAVDTAPAIHSSSNTSPKSQVDISSDVQSAAAKRRASLRTWLGSRKSISKSTPSVALE